MRRLSLAMCFTIMAICMIGIASEPKSMSDLNVDLYYLVNEDGQGNYTLILFDLNGTVVLEETYPLVPSIRFLGESVIQVGLSMGSPNKYVYFYDISTNAISEVFYNPNYLGDRTIANREDNKLIISDTFDRSFLYFELRRNFSQTATHYSSVSSVRFLGDGRFEVWYLEGPEYHLVIEVIDTQKFNPIVRRSYPFLDIYFGRDDEWLIIDYRNVLSEEEEFWIIARPTEIDHMKEFLSVDTFPVGRGTFPVNILYVFLGGELHRYIPYIEMYIECRELESKFVKVEKESVWDLVSQLVI